MPAFCTVFRILTSFSALVPLFGTGFAHAHSITTGLGSIEAIPAGHYHLHVPVELDFQGNLVVHNMFSTSGEHDHGSEAGHDEETTDGLDGAFTLAISGDTDRLTRIVNRSEVELPLEEWKVPLATESTPAWRVSSRRASYSVGPDAHVGPVIGLTALPGKESSFFHRAVCRKPDCSGERTDRLRSIPANISYWKDRAPGERMVLSKAKGLHLHMTFGPHLIGAIGPVSTLEGTWSVVAEREKNDTLRVEFHRDRLRSYGIEAEGLLSAISVANHHFRGESFVARIRLQDAEAQKAYAHLLGGHWVYLKTLAAQSDAVRIVELGKSLTRARSFGAQTGIPFLAGVAFEKSRSTTATLEDEGHHEYVTVTQKLVQGRGHLSRHLLRGEFIVGVVEPPHSDQNDEHGEQEHLHDSPIGLTALWVFEKDQTSDERVENWLHRQGKKLGIPELSKLNIDGRADGYLRAELRILFPAELLEGWLGISGPANPASNSFTLPDCVRNSHSWERIRRDAHHAKRRGNRRALSQSLSRAGKLLVRHFAEIRRHAVAKKQRLSVTFEVRFAGERIPLTRKAWRLVSAEPPLH